MTQHSVTCTAMLELSLELLSMYSSIWKKMILNIRFGKIWEKTFLSIPSILLLVS